MTKFLFGVSIGYIFSDAINELLGRVSFGEKESSPVTGPSVTSEVPSKPVTEQP